jgi:hypothetical protein
MFKWLKIPDKFYLGPPEGFDASKLSWSELRDQLNYLNKMEFHFAAVNITEILKRIMDRIDETKVDAT